MTTTGLVVEPNRPAAAAGLGREVTKRLIDLVRVELRSLVLLVAGLGALVAARSGEQLSSDRTVARVVKATTAAASLPGDWAGHRLLRRGMITTAPEQGESTQAIGRRPGDGLEVATARQSAGD